MLCNVALDKNRFNTIIPGVGQIPRILMPPRYFVELARLAYYELLKPIEITTDNRYLIDAFEPNVEG